MSAKGFVDVAQVDDFFGGWDQYPAGLRLFERSEL